MKTFDLIAMCMRNLFRRKVRTLLTVVGVVVGTCAIVVMISIGLGMKESQDMLLAQMGDLTLIEIYAYGNVNAQGQEIILDDKALAEIMGMNGVRTATPFYYPRYLDAQLFGGRNERYMTYFYNVVGIYPEALPLLGYELLEGDWEDAFSEPYSILMGQYGAYSFQDTRKSRGQNRVNPYPDATGNIPDPYVDVLKDKLLIRLSQQNQNARKVEYKPVVTGVLKEDWQRGYETSRGMFMSVTDIKKMEADYIKANNIKLDSSQNTDRYDNARVKVADIKFVDPVETAIKDMGFDTYSMETIRKPMEEQTQRQQGFLLGIAGISFFVAALGIANTMLMSIYERTREIGVMKVVGCYVRDIRTLFLMEAGCIGLIGGVIGIGISYFISFLMNYFGLDLGLGSDMAMYYGGATEAARVSIITPELVAGAMLFSICIGLISGYYPANRAVKISALTAIRQE